MNRQTTQTGAQDQHTMRALTRGFLLGVVLFAGPVWLTGCRCFFADEIQTGNLIYSRTIFIIFDQTASLDKVGAAARAVNGSAPGNDFTDIIKRVVKSDVLDQLQLGDNVECYQIGSNDEAYDENSYRVFSGKRFDLRVRANIADGSLTENQIKGDCPSEINARKDLDSQWERFGTAKEAWRKDIDAAPQPKDKCCSAYLAALDFIGRRLQEQPGKKWLVVVGDLLEEPALTKWRQESNSSILRFSPLSPPAPADNQRNAFSGVEVLVLQPSGAQPIPLRGELEKYWTSYFAARGNAQIKFATDGSPLKPRVPLPTPTAGR